MTGFASSLSATSAASALRLRRLGRRQIELEVLALPHVFDAVVAERVERLGDRAALRIEHRWLQRDEDSRAHAAHPCERVNAAARRAPRLGDSARRWPTHENAIENMVDVPELLVEIERPLDLGRRQAPARRRDPRASRLLKSRCSSNERIALRCTHS